MDFLGQIVGGQVALDVAMAGGSPVTAIVDLGILAAFTAVFFGVATWTLARRLV